MTATITREGDRLILATDFAQKDAVKRLPTRRWDKRRGIWHVAATQETAAATRARLGDLTVDEGTLKLMARAAAAEAARPLRFADELPPIPGVGKSALNPEGGGWLSQRRAYWFGLEQEGCGLIMGMGCLTGDAEVTINRGLNSRRHRLGDVVTKFNGGKVKGYSWDLDIPTYVRGLKADGTLGLCRLVAAHDNGIKPVVKLTLMSGKEVTCTYDHEIVTPGGKVEAGDLKVGAEVLTNGRYLDKDGYIRLRGTGHPREGTGGVYEHILVAEEKIGRRLEPGETVHHRNEIKHDNDPSNLDVKETWADHMAEHVDVLRLDGGIGRFIPFVDKLTSVEGVGEERVYDLTVDDEAHTYVANGIVVGNSGKSLVTVKLLEAWGVRLVVILCPSKVRKVWPREFSRWSDREWIVDNGRFKNKQSGRWLKSTSVSMQRRVDRMYENIERGRREDRPVAIVVNYEAAWQGVMRDFLLGLSPDVLVLDESHKVKKPGGKWSRFTEQLGKRAPRRVALTGTLFPHSEPDVYAQYRTVDPGVFGTNFKTFRLRYFEMGGFEDKEIVGFLSDTARKEFTETWQRIAYIDEEGPDTPGAIDAEPATAEMGSEVARLYKELSADFITWVKGGGDDEEPVTAANALARILRLQQITSGHVPIGVDDDREIRIIGDEKKRLLHEELDDIPPGEPVVVYARFTEDLNRIEEVAKERGMRYAEISGRRDDGLTEDADDPANDAMMADCDLLGAQLQAVAEGIDLTRSCYGIFYSEILDLGNNLQVRKRQDRPGQMRQVRFGHLELEGTIDAIIRQALINREDAVGAVVAAAKEFGRLEAVEDI